MDRPNTDDEINPYVASTVSLIEPATSGNRELASRGSRLLAVLIDYFIWVLDGVFIWVLIPTSFQNDFLHVYEYSLAIVVSISVLAIAITQLVFIAKYAGTIGKRIMGIKVVRYMTGENCGRGRYFWLRFAPAFLIFRVPMVGLVGGLLLNLIDTLFIFTEGRRCLHDLIADTEVVVA